MIRVLVTGLAVGTDVGLCGACNYDFEWLFHYLVCAFAVACEWIRSLTLVLHERWSDDLPKNIA